MQELRNFTLSFNLPQTGDELHFQCDARRMVEADNEIQVGAIISEPDEEALEKLRTYLI